MQWVEVTDNPKPSVLGSSLEQYALAALAAAIALIIIQDTGYLYLCIMPGFPAC